jgi:hypothetical protein
LQLLVTLLSRKRCSVARCHNAFCIHSPAPRLKPNR